MAILLIGIAVAINFCVLIYKFRLNRYFDMFIDSFLLAVICILFSGTFSALAAGTVASAIISFYLLRKPLTVKEVKAHTRKRRKRK